MKIDDIKDPVLKKLFEEVSHYSATIGEDAGDALEESNSDEELIANWQSKLESLREEIQHFWGDLEAMKQGSHKNDFCPSCGAAAEKQGKICSACGKTTMVQNVKCPACGKDSTMGTGINPEDWQCPFCGWTAS